MSYTSQQFLLFDNSSNANFQNWAGAIAAALAAAGWTTTSDSGQTAPGSAAAPASGAFIYQIWQPADALQTGATAYYVKVKYGTGSGSPAGPRLQVQIGTGTDGAGNLTGLTTSNQEMTGASSTGQGSITTYDCYFSGDIDRFSMLLWRPGPVALSAQIITIERTRNTDGTGSSDCVNLITVGNTGGPSAGVFTINFTIGVSSLATRGYPAVFDTTNASAAFNNNIPMSPVFPIYGKIGNPLTTIGFVHTQDVAEACFFTTSLYGATRTYIATNGNGTFVTTPSNSKVCMRYD